MSYLKINNVDFSHCVNKLDINRKANYNAQMNAAGNTVVDYINSKREIVVGIIPLDDAEMKTLQAAIESVVVSISFINPMTNLLEENVLCILPENAVSYYTIQAGKIMFNAFELTFTEL